jgi:GAF domain-containing protein
MHLFSSLPPDEVDALLKPILVEAIRVTGFEKGNIQLFDRKRGALSIVCQHGFDSAFLKTFEGVNADTECACGRALKTCRAIFIKDVEADAKYAPYRDAALQAGYRSVLSVPIVAEGEIVAVMSVHHPMPQASGPTDIGHIGEFAAGLIRRQSLIG